MAEHPKILDLPALVAERERLRAAGRSVVQCHGCFDIVHPGHLRYLKFAKDQGDVLVVTVTADEVVGKGADRPYITERLRLENLAAIEYVDFVCLDRNHWAGPILEAVRPDVYVKGKEYATSSDPRFAREKDLVESQGGKVIFSSGDVVYSSTFILSQFRERFRFEEDKISSFVERHGLTRSRLEERISGFPKRRVLVVGDPILDRYVHCDAVAVASEGPLLSVVPLRDEWFAGAGALIARQIVTLGGEAELLTPLGAGADAERFSSDLERAGVSLVAIGTDERPLYTKTRYLVDETKVFKVNSGGPAPLSTRAERDLLAALEARLPEFEALVVVDFGYGLFSAGLAARVAEVAARVGVPYFTDVSQGGGANILRFRGPAVATPTEEELRFAFADRESGLSNLASRYYEETGAGALVITMGKRGSVLFDRPARPGERLTSDYLPALRTASVDPVGAGDVFLSLVVLSELGGGELPVGVYLGTAASSLHVSRLGNEPVQLDDLLHFLESRAELA